MIVRSITRRYDSPDFALAIPVLKSAFHVEEGLSIRITAAEGLTLFDPLHAQEYVEFMRRVLKESDDQAELLQAINALGHMGPVASEAIGELVQCIAHKNQEVRVAALQALRVIRPRAEWAEPLLASLSEASFCSLDLWSALWEQHEFSRLVVRLLIDMGREGVPRLFPYMRSSQQLLRLVAATAISKVGWAPSEAISTIVDAMMDGEFTKVCGLGHSFDVIRWFDEPMAVLSYVRHHENVEIRRAFFRHARGGRMRQLPLQDWIVYLCEAAIAEQDEPTRDGILGLVQSEMGRLGDLPSSAQEQVLRFILRAIDESESARRTVFDHLLDGIGAETRTWLLSWLSTDFGVSVDLDDAKMVEILRRPDRQAQDRLSEFLQACNSNQPIGVLDAQTLRQLGSLASAAIPAIIAKLESSTFTDDPVRADLGYMIARIGPREPICRELLRDENWQVRHMTLVGLCESEDRPEDLPDLIQAQMLDEVRDVRLRAAMFLWSVAGQAIPAVRAILSELPTLGVIGGMDHEIIDGPPLEWWHIDWSGPIEQVLNMAQSEPTVMDDVSTAWRAHPESINLARLYSTLTKRHEEVIEKCLVQWLVFGEPREVIAALELLQQMAASASTALPALCKLLDGDYWLYRFYALQVIASIGPVAARVARNVLKTMRSRPDERECSLTERDVRVTAARTLGVILPGISNLEETLLRVLDNSYVCKWISELPDDSDPSRMLARLVERLELDPPAVN